ncbi:sugar transferase [Devosia sp. A449]
MYESFGKRLLDIVMALVLAPIAIPLCLGCIIAIRLGDGGAAVFRQTRVGLRRKPFVLYKLRTMSVGTGDRASHEVSGSHITAIGKVLRKTKLDELPQLLNVLWGDMSFVGPRPCLPSQNLLVEERDRLGVFGVRPGITGPAQVSGVDMSSPHELAAIDAAYAKSITLVDDFRYILQTALGRGSGDAVKRD